jgi:hypothetical protein
LLGGLEVVLRFAGIVVAAFVKLGGSRRHVVENPDGMLHIFCGRNLALTIAATLSA